MNMKRCIRAAACLLLTLLAALPAPPAQAAAVTNVKVAVDCKLPPFQYVGDDGVLKGMHIDLMNEIARRGNLLVEYVVFERTMDAVDALVAGEVDAVLGALPGDIGVYKEELKLTPEISSASTCMVVNNEKLDRVLYPEENRSRYIAAFELNTLELSHLSELNIMYTVIMGNQTQLYNALVNRDVDAIITVKDSVQHLMDRDGVSERYTIARNYMTSVYYSILVRKNDRVLYRTLDETIGQLRTSDQYEQIVDKWIVNVELETAQARIQKLLIFIGIIAGVAAIIIGNTVYMNVRLKELVAEKTREISRRMGQLEAAGALRNRLIEHSPGGSLLLRGNGNVLLMNSVARSMAGVSEEAAPAENIRDLPVFGNIWEKAAPGAGITMERPALITLDTEEAGRRTYRYQCHATSTPEDTVLLVEDVTREEREKQEIYEESKNQSLNRIIAGIAHEIKNPLMSIRAFASLIRRQGDDPEFQASFGEYVPKEVDRINRLIETLINYARPPRGQKERILIGDLIEDCVCLAYVSAKKEIVLQCEVSARAYVYGNKDQLRQALINLLINSIESVEAKLSAGGAPAEGLRVCVSGFRRAGSVVVEVYDEGIGMSESAVQKCTEPFFTTKKTGTGMGLALAKQFVQENAGQFEIESTPGAHTAIRMIFEEDIEK